MKEILETLNKKFNEMTTEMLMRLIALCFVGGFAVMITGIISLTPNKSTIITKNQKGEMIDDEEKVFNSGDVHLTLRLNLHPWIFSILWSRGEKSLLHEDERKWTSREQHGRFFRIPEDHGG